MKKRASAGQVVAILIAASAAISISSGPALASRAAPASAATSAKAMQAHGESGGLIGTVLGDTAGPMAGVCVSAQPAAEPFRPAGRVAVTTQAGMFTLSGLTAGEYNLSYRDCAHAGVIAWPARAALNAAALLTPAVPSRAFVVGGHVIRLAPVTVGFAGRAFAMAAGAMPALPRVRVLTPAQTRQLQHAGAQNWGGISGTVFGPHHRPLGWMCVNVVGKGFTEGTEAGRDGKFEIPKNLPPGKYPVEFTPLCSPVGLPLGNWAPQWYRNKYHQATANLVVVKANKITQHIDATMRRGAVVTGTVTGRHGRGVAAVCVVATAPNGIVAEQQVNTGRDGRYRIEALDPGQVRMGFFPGCEGGFTPYLPQWWPGSPTEAKSGLIRLWLGSHRRHIDAKLATGGTISGTIRFRNRHGRPIKGICVFIQPADQPNSGGFSAASLADGFYSERGLPAGRYSVSFGPGCNNNGNYLYQNYPHNVTVRLSAVTGNINAYMQPGAIVTGKVTDKATGKPLGGICVSVNNGYGLGETRPDGAYYVDQLPPGKVPVEFSNCNNRGNYAPQYYPDQVNPAAGLNVTLRGGVVSKGIDAAMTPGATISGRLVSTSGKGLSTVCADAVPTGDGLPTGSFATLFGFFGQSTKGGRYAVENLPPGQYQVAFGACGGGGPNVADQWFMNRRDAATAALINLSAGQQVAQINDVMQSAGAIAGAINGPAGQQGAFMCLSVTNASTGIHSFGEYGSFLQVGDTYVLGGLATGSYNVEFQPCGGENLALQWYNDANSPAGAHRIHVTAGHTIYKVDSNLVPGGIITGRVFNNRTGKPMPNVCISAQGTSQPFSGFGSSDRSGRYRVTGLNTGVYRLYFVGCGSAHLLTVVFARVRATMGRTVPGPDPSMTPFQPGAISGRVRAAAPGAAPLPGACVNVLPAAGGYGESQAYGQTGIGGYYRIGDLVPGKYKVNFDPSCVTEAGGQVPQWYDRKPSRSTATIVTVVGGRTTRRISATLQQDGSITGTVTGVSHQPLTGICVQAISTAGPTPPFLAVSTSPSGSYNLGPVNPGRYLVEFSSGCGATGYPTRWWRGAGSARKATVVIVRAGVIRHAIDATMTRQG